MRIGANRLARICQLRAYWTYSPATCGNGDGKMGFDGKATFAAIGDWLGSLGVALSAAVSTPLEPDPADLGESADDRVADSSHRYGHTSPGYLTRNGLGSLEIGAADD
jgi:hypothetical protein